MKGISSVVTVVIAVVLGVMILFAVGGPAFALVQKGFADLFGLGGKFSKTPIEQAIEFSLQRCEVGCNDINLKSSTDSNLYNKYCTGVPESFKEGTDQKICGWNAQQYPVEYSENSVTLSRQIKGDGLSFSCITTNDFTWQPGIPTTTISNPNFLHINKDVISSYDKEPCITGSLGTLLDTISTATLKSGVRMYIYTYSGYPELGGLKVPPFDPIKLFTDPASTFKSTTTQVTLGVPYLVLVLNENQEDVRNYETDKTYRIVMANVAEGFVGISRTSQLNQIIVKVNDVSSEEIAMGQGSEAYFKFGDKFLHVKVVDWVTGSSQVKLSVSYTSKSGATKLPQDGDGWTESLSSAYTPIPTLGSLDDAKVGSHGIGYSDDLTLSFSDFELGYIDTVNSKYKTINFYFKAAENGAHMFKLYDFNDRCVYRQITTASKSEWVPIKFDIGSTSSGWKVCPDSSTGDFNWKIASIKWDSQITLNKNFVDGLYFQ